MIGTDEQRVPRREQRQRSRNVTNEQQSEANLRSVGKRKPQPPRSTPKLLSPWTNTSRPPAGDGLLHPPGAPPVKAASAGSRRTPRRRPGLRFPRRSTSRRALPAGACAIASAEAASKRSPAAEPKIGPRSSTVSDPAAALLESHKGSNGVPPTGTLGRRAKQPRRRASARARALLESDRCGHETRLAVHARASAVAGL
jgi:hypothetical protein